MESAKGRGTVCTQRTCDCGCCKNCSLWEKSENTANPPHNFGLLSSSPTFLHILYLQATLLLHTTMQLKGGGLCLSPVPTVPYNFIDFLGDVFNQHWKNPAFMMKSKRGAAAAGATKRGVRRGCAVTDI